MTIVLYNGLAGNGTGESQAKEIGKYLEGEEFEFVDITKIEDLEAYFGKYEKNQKFVLAGGDGTLHHFINAVEEKKIPEELFFFPCGSGNDFWNDIAFKEDRAPRNIHKYLVSLPTFLVNGKEGKFLNGVGAGIDGYCCEVGDEIRKTSDKPVNYGSIAVKGVLGKYKPANAKITVDGETKEYKKCWLAPVMNGRYFGGGMNATPAQDRLNEGRLLSSMAWHGSGRLPTLFVFPKIFKGEHVKKTKMIEIRTGKHIIVEFDRPIACEIDGETVLNVSRVEVKSAE